MLTINQLTGFAAQGIHAQASFIASSDNTSLTTGTHNATFSSINLGTPEPNRVIAVCIAGYVLTSATAALTINSVTIGGVSATIVSNLSKTNTSSGGEGSASCIAYIEESTLTSGNIVVNYTCSETGTGPVTDLTVAVYNITNQNNNAPYNTSSNSGNSGTSVSENVSVPLLGCTIGAATNGGGGPGNASWTNLTQDVLTGNTLITGHNNTASQGTLSVAINAAPIVCTTLSLASWQ